MRFLNLFFAAAFMLFVASCEEQPVVIPEFTAEDTGRVVLIEEITGVKCPNCPAGAATIENLKESFPNRVISIAYHSPPFLVDPLAESQYDFRRDEAQAISDYIGQAIGKPSAAINRVKFDSEQRTWVESVDNWGGHVQSQLEEAPDLKLQITNTYDAATRELNIQVTGTPFQTTTGAYKLHVMMVESHIIDPQLDQTQEIEDYEHNHVFHDMISSGVSGDAFATGLTQGEDVVKNYNYTLPTNEQDPKVPWVAENCEVIAFVTKEDGSVAQVVQKKVVE